MALAHVKQFTNYLDAKRAAKSCGREQLSDKALLEMAQWKRKMSPHLEKCLPCLNAYARMVSRVERGSV